MGTMYSVFALVAFTLAAILFVHFIKRLKLYWREFWQDCEDDAQARRNERRDQAEAHREALRTIGVDRVIAKALEMNESDFRRYARQNAREIIDRRSEIIQEARSNLGTSTKVEMFSDEELTAVTAELRLVKEARGHIANGGQFKDDKRLERENAELYGLRQQLIGKYGFPTNVNNTRRQRRLQKFESQATEAKRGSTNGTPEPIEQ